MKAVINTQVRHRRLSRLHVHSLDVLRKREDNGITFEGAVSDCDICTLEKAQQLAHPKTASRKINRPAYSGPNQSIRLVSVGQLSAD